MRRRRLPLGILLPAGLLVLLGSLAVLQYRWLGQVSAAEREELSRSLDQRVQAFGEDFDLEISRANFAFQLGDDPVTVDRPQAIEKRLTSWRAVARYPALVRDVYLAERREATYSLYRYEPGAASLTAMDWPADLEPVRRRLSPESLPAVPGVSAPHSVVSFSTSALLQEVPALLVPLVRHEPPVPSEPPSQFRTQPLEMVVRLRTPGDTLVVRLDDAYLKNEMLADLVGRHFSQDEAVRYRISVVDGTGAALLSRGLAAGETLTSDTADVTTRFFGLRLEMARLGAATTPGTLAWQTTTVVEGTRTGRAGGRGAGVRAAETAAGSVQILLGRPTTTRNEFMARVASPSWQLLVQHAAGSLDAAVAEARLRNLWLSFGILSVLAVSVGLIVLNARRSERLAVQQMDFVATVSHELRTPLAVIRSAAQNLSAGVVSDAGQARRYGDLIETEGRRLTDMVEQVLEYAGLSGNRRLVRAVPIDPGDVVRTAVASASPFGDHPGIELEVAVAPELPFVEADEDALRRAIGNLVTNALKYGADGGWIGITADRATERGRDEVRISIADRGRGIEPDDLPHIFEPFYRGRYAVERQIHGNGLGLSLVRRIVEAHGGRVSVTSVRGEGTTFTLHLPAVSPDASVQPVGHTLTDAAPHA